MADTQSTGNPVLSAKTKEATLFRGSLTASFVILLLLAMITRCLPRQWRPAMFRPDEDLSIVDAARAAANTFVPLAFMD